MDLYGPSGTEWGLSVSLPRLSRQLPVFYMAFEKSRIRCGDASLIFLISMGSSLPSPGDPALKEILWTRHRTDPSLLANILEMTPLRVEVPLRVGGPRMAKIFHPA